MRLYFIERWDVSKGNLGGKQHVHYTAEENGNNKHTEHTEEIFRYRT